MYRTSLIFIALVLVQCADTMADITYGNDLVVKCRKMINGTMRNFLNIHIDLKNPQLGDDVGWGTAKLHTGNDGKLNCNNVPYDYAVVQIDANWTSHKLVDGVIVVFSQADNKAYWDEFYTGYTAPAACDYSQNCHGYAFDVGDGPLTAEGIIDAAAASPCWVAATNPLAVVATNRIGHSIKVTGANCPVAGGPKIPPIPVILTSHEQYQESGVYSQSTVCPNTLTLKLTIFELLKPR